MSLRDIHQVSVEQAYAMVGAREAGLTSREADERRRIDGPNVLHAPRRLAWLRRAVHHGLNFFCILLYVAAGVCFTAEFMQPGGHMNALGWALLGVAVLNGIFAFAQEHRAERAMEELKKFLPQRVRVRRDGRETETLADSLVRGDVLLLEEGDQIPADARLVASNALLVNKAPLTGESRSVALAPAADSAPRRADSHNLVFAGCTVVRGSGVALVYATGRRTEFGQIAALSHETPRPPSPLERELGRMVRVLTAVAVAMGLLVFAYGVISGRSIWLNLVFMLGIIVANVPEGLLPTFTLALSMAGRRMARKNVLVKSLGSVEALGAVQVICTDKTGTLTRNELTIVRLVDGVTGDDLPASRHRRRLLEAALIASDVHQREGSWRGDPLDLAVANRYALEHGDPHAVMQRTRRHFPFDLARRREAGLLIDEGRVVFAVKGAWENLRPLIGAMATGDESAPLPATDDRLQATDRLVHDLAAQGYRVIAVARRRLAAEPDPQAAEETLEKRLTLRGLLALEDPLRDEAPDAVRRCQEAGIRVVLVTGDHPRTGLTIAQRCGIAPADAAGGTVLSGDDLERLSPDDLGRLLDDGVTVFARTTPEQKSKIVDAVRRRGLVVAMTGDGVNDAPALRAANVGIAMGQGGTDVAREAADIVLLDNNFASIVAGVEEGRAVFANMQKFTSYVLTSNVPEILPYLLHILFPVPLALTVIQILSIDLGTDVVPAMGLGQEPPEPDTMKRPPRRSHERLLTARLLLLSYLFLGLIQAACSLSLFFLLLWLQGWRWGQELPETSPAYQSATGVTLAAIILMQIGNVVGRRSFRGSGLDRGLLTNRLLLLGIALEASFAWALLYWPPLAAILGTGPIPGGLFALAWLGIPLIFLLDFARKRWLAAARAKHAA